MSEEIVNVVDVEATDVVETPEGVEETIAE